MKTDYVIWVVVGVLVVLALVSSWLLSSNWSTPYVATTTPQSTQTPAKSTGGTTAKPVAPAPVKKVYASGLLPISELLKIQGATYSCTFTVSSPYRSGEFILGNNKWRGRFVSGVTMIDDGKYIWLWADGATEGLQVIATSGVVGNTLVQRGGIDVFTPLNYECSPWTVDASRFVPPSGIVFKNTEGYLYQ